MKKLLLVAVVLLLAGAAVAGEAGEKRTKTAMVLSSVLPGAGQFYLGNTGNGFYALGTELVWWAGAGAFFLAGKLSADEAARSVPPRADSLKGLSTGMYIGSAVFGLAALGWRAMMVSNVHDDAVAKNYRQRFLDVKVGLKPEMDGVKVGLYRGF